MPRAESVPSDSEKRNPSLEKVAMLKGKTTPGRGRVGEHKRLQRTHNLNPSYKQAPFKENHLYMAFRARYVLGLRDPPGYSLVGPSRLFLSEYPAQTSALANVWPANQLPPSTGKFKYGQTTETLTRLILCL